MSPAVATEVADRQGSAVSAGGRRRGTASWIRSHAGMVAVLLVPLVVFLAPLVVGRVVLDGDNFLQNFPMRVLAAHDLQHGSLPFLNPYLFSGTPLLGGFNAGAAYPTTWLLAVLPRFAGWSLNLALAYDVAALGMYLFLRRQSLRPTPATFAAATFAFAGYLSSQMVHVDLIEAAAWLPWTLLAVDALLPAAPFDRVSTRDRARSPRSFLRWAAVLALAVGLTVLTGGAEVIIDGLLGVAIYALWQLVGQVHRGIRVASAVRSVAWMLAGLAAGFALGAAQLLPGLFFNSQSQRGGASYSFFTTGSLDYHLLALAVSPFVLGTSQRIPGLYVGQYNLQEASSYMGVLALVAVGVLWSRRFRRRPEARAWRVWYAVAAFGLLSALGGATPFGRLLFLVPLVHNERLLNRNLLLVDLALAVLLGWWLQALCDRPEAPASVPARSPGRRRLSSALGWRPGRRVEILLTMAPAALMIVAAVAMWANGALVLRLLDAMFPLPTSSLRGVAVLVTAGALVGVAGTTVVLLESRLSLTALRRALAVVLTVDLALFAVYMQHVPIPQTTAQAQTPRAAAMARLTAGGRFLVYDPDQFYPYDLYALGQTDLNIFPGTPSGQGYTALTDAGYYRATGAHFQEDLDPSSLRGPVWDQLNATVLLSVPSYFVTPRGPAPPGGSSVPYPPNPSAAARVYTGAPLDTEAPVALAPGSTHVWYLGGLLSVTGWSVPVPGGSRAALAASVITPNGARRPVAAGGQGTELEVGGTGSREAGVAVRNTSNRTVTVGVPVLTAHETGTVALDGRMQYGVGSAHWRYTGTLGPFAVFRNTRARGWAWAAAPRDTAPVKGAIVAASAPEPNGDQRVTVRASGSVDLVRSMSWTSGWRATASAAGPGGESRSVPVDQDGLVQRVTLPAGTWTVSFSYEPAEAIAGVVVSGVVGAALLGWLVVDFVLWIRRRRSDPSSVGRSPGSEAAAARTRPDAQAGERSPIASAARP